MPYYYVLTPEEDKRARTLMAERLAARSRTNFEGLSELLPGREKKSGRERLADYRSTDEAYWAQLFASYPDTARAAIMEWAGLLSRYGHDEP